MSDIKRIFLISTFYGKQLGGAEISIKLLFDALKPDCPDSKLITLQSVQEPGVISLRLQWIPKKLFIFGNIFLDKYIAFKLRNVLKEGGELDVLHVQDLFSLPAVVQVARSLNISAIATVRDNLPREYRILGFNVLSWRNRVYYQALLKCKSIVAISQSIRTTLINFGIPAEKIHVIYNIVSAPLLKERTIENNIPIILALGRMDQEKGFHVLLEALALIDEDRIPFVLHLVGDGPEKRNLQFLAKKLSIENKVKFLPWMDNDDVYHSYAECDLVVFPSIYAEPLGRVALEAGAASRPIVASKIGGIVEIVKDAKTGILVEPGNPEELASAVKCLLISKQMRKILGKQANKYIKENFAAKVVIVSHLALHTAP